MVSLTDIKPCTDLHSFTTAASRSAIIFMGRTVLLHPERMCSVFNEAISICWNLGKKDMIIAVTHTDQKCNLTLELWALTKLLQTSHFG